MTTTDTNTRADEEELTENIYDHHPFNFGIWRHSDPVDEEPTADAEAEEPATVVADGGIAVTTVCPDCEGELINVQGVPACSDCTWTAR